MTLSVLLMPKSVPAPKNPNASNSAVEARGDAYFEQECVAFFGDLIQAMGVPRSVGMIYGLLFASSTPLRFTDIAERLDISRGSASQGLHALRMLGAVRIVPNSSPHRELFEPELGLRALVSGLLREKVGPIVNDGAAQMRRLRDAAEGANEPAQRKFYVGRVKQIEIWRRQMGLLLPILTTILGSRRTG